MINTYSHNKNDIYSSKNLYSVCVCVCKRVCILFLFSVPYMSNHRHIFSTFK